jgi:glutathione S-transferase
MAGEELTLLGLWASPFVIRVRIAFNLKGLTAYVYSEESIYHKSELLLKSNPVLKKVPVLLHDGKTICESQIILQYVDEAFPTAAGAPVLPSDPYDRAIARFWASYVDDKVRLLTHVSITMSVSISFLNELTTSCLFGKSRK